MGSIVLLDDNTINKIAAGEVIERPASVVKELMENSIDAGATSIKVEIKNGGISYIRITDNGKGIAADDMEIAFERHATSKIRKAEDIEKITSMGFRGEALASIAAISKIEMISKTADNEIGHKIELEGGKIINKEETGCSKGTTITIQDLFFNTPVRYKFLKKDFTEAGYIEDAVTRIALVHPEIAIQLINTGKTIIQTPGNNDFKAVIYSIYGKDIAENILEVNYEFEDIKVIGIIGKPVIARSNRSNQLFFVNKRYIKDKTLTSAAEQGYKGLITIGKYGFLVLNIEISPQKVDVNVHPAKLEVRFEEENKVFKAVYHSIKDTLLKGDLIADTEKVKDDFKDSMQKYEMQKNNKYGATLPVNSQPVEEGKKIGNLFNKINKDKKEEYYPEEKDDGNLIAQLYANKFNLSENKESPYELPVSGGVNEEENSVMKKPSFLTNLKDDEEKSNIDLKNEEVLKQEAIDKLQNKKIDENKEIFEKENNIEQDQTDDSQKTDTENDQTKIINAKEVSEKLKEDINELDKLKMDFNTENFDEMYIKTFGTLPSEAKKAAQEEEKSKTIQLEELKSVENISIFPKNTKQVPYYKFIGIAFSTYIILELGNDLYILDQHAAHERIMYEKVKKNYYSDETKDSQLMLLPDIINLSHKEMDIAKENMDMFRKAGFTLEEFGENTIKLSGVPNICIDLDTKELFLETLDEINTVARTAKQEKEEKFIATVACKAAVKANMALTKEEVDNLMKQLLVLPNPFTCPHGRPTAIKMSKNDIEKKFSRR